MIIKEWLNEVERYNFPSEERQKELAWIQWKCADNVLDSLNNRIKQYLEPLNNSIKSSWNIEIINTLQKENYGWTLTTVALKQCGNEENIFEITDSDYTMMYRYNVYHNGKHLKGTDNLEQLIELLQKSL